MWNKKFEKGLSIVEALVATAILGMLVAIFINSSSIFMRTQQDLVKKNKQNQIADLIIQDISEYVKSELNPYGNITVDSFDNKGNPTLRKINISGVTISPEVEDLFAIEGVEGKYRIAEIPVHVSGDAYTITTDTNLPADTTITSNLPITFIAFNKLELECFTAIDDGKIVGVNLKEDHSAAEIFESLEFADDETCKDPPDEIITLVDSWKAEIDTLGRSVTLANVIMSDEQLFKVTIGDITNQTSLAKKFVQCAFSASTEETTTSASLDFKFPGMSTNGTDLKVATGIMEGTKNPIFHYGFNLDSTKTRYWKDANDDGTGGTKTEYDPKDLADECIHIGASPCRQNYAKHKYVTVFLYRYIGDDTVTVQPAGCKDTSSWKQCDERVTFYGKKGEKTGDLSIWFIYSEADAAPTTIDNKVGYIGFSIEYLNRHAKVGVFDDSGESCLASIISMGTDHKFDDKQPYKCEGGYDYNNAHDGLVVHLATDKLTSLFNVTLDVINSTDNIEGWRVLNAARCDLADPVQDPTLCKKKMNPDPCLLAENDGRSAHKGGVVIVTEGGKKKTKGVVADNAHCWTLVTAPNTVLSSILNKSATEMSVEAKDWDKFPAKGYLQVGNEAIYYASKENSGGTYKFKGLIRGVRNTVQVETKGSKWITFKEACQDRTAVVKPFDPEEHCEDEYNTTQADHARIISGEDVTDEEQKGSKLRIARWVGWVDEVKNHKIVKDKEGLKIQQQESRKFGHYKMNKFRISSFNKTSRAVPNNIGGADDFNVGDKYVVHNSGDQTHTNGSRNKGLWY